MTKYKIVLQYVGSRYSGWQIQKGVETIQGNLCAALQTLTGETTSVIGSGRTDAGVHALHQVGHFVLSKKISREKLLRGLNGILPWDIQITRIQYVDLGFHAQQNAWKKRYQYRIYNGRGLSPFWHGYVYHLRSPLDLQAMQESAEQLAGWHDFCGFTATASKVKDFRRQIFLSNFTRRGRHILYRIEANGFLHHMVRNITGTLMEIGLNQRPISDIKKILKCKDRRIAGRTAPAHGLYLVKVWY